MQILVVEDHKKIAHFIRRALANAGHTVDEIHDGHEAARVLAGTPYDLVVLDIVLPGRDGLSVLRQLRADRNGTPVLLLTARSEVEDRIAGLDFGADDYVTKPFEMEELLARVNALLRRAGGNPSALLKADELILNTLTRDVRRGAEKVHLSQREFELLEFLMRSPDRTHSRAEICAQVWQGTLDAETNVVEVYIQRLRKKIDDGHAVKLIHTIRGSGYAIGPRT